MKLLIEKVLNLRTYYIKQVRMILAAEEETVKGLETLRDAASDVQLREAFQSHREETKVHITRLKRNLSHTAGETDELKCKSISALIQEAAGVIEETDPGPLRDAALIAAAQRVEHYEIAAYGALRSFAQALQLPGEVETLDLTLQEEARADELLSSISDRLNHEALKLAS
jgi:ferritin-like metal-binding protein YciE